MENIIQTPIINEIEQSFLDYSVSVITDRAIPSAEDGLKPVARRILWDMFDKGYLNNKKFVKCAQPVGDTMGRFHPHGDSSIYGALCWLSQPWSMRYPLIDFHGNNGSRDGDEAAAYRYTECKLSKLGEEMLNDIKKNTVDWQLAYTDEEEEPIYLPGRIPNLIVNGTSGIAVAMACSFAPHNLNEVMDAIIYLLENNECSVKDLMNYITGPDFPTGGMIINKNELINAYSTGKGRARIRGEYTIETSGGKDTIVFTSIPYKVSKEDLIVAIDKLCENNEIDGITSIRDESNHEGVRFVIELNKGANTNNIINKLFKKTNLENTYSINQVALVDKKPRLLNLKQLLENYLIHQKDVLARKTQYDLNKAQAKLHILEGLLIALNNIDDIITLIKKSESAAVAKSGLMTAYNLSEAQAKAILDMKLSKLAKLEKEEIENEKREIELLIQKLNEILINPIPELKRIFTEIKNKYGDARRTIITHIDPPKEEKEIINVEPEKCVVVMTQGGLIKRVPSKSFKTQNRNTKGVRTQDDITAAVIRTNTIDQLMIFTNQGRMYRLLVDTIPVGTNTSLGVNIKSLLAMEMNEEPSVIYSIYRDTDAKYILFTTKKGYLKKTLLEEYIKTKKKTGLPAINIMDDDELVSVNLIKDEQLFIVTASGMNIRINSSEITPSGRVTRGLKGITLKENDYVVATWPIRHDTDDVAIFTKSGLGKRMPLKDFTIQKRAGKGTICYKGTSEVVAAALVSDEDRILIIGNKSSICIAATEIPKVSKMASGNILIKDNQIMSVSKV